MTPMFETASFHIVKPCNMKCKFCYATFDDMRVISQISIESVKDILLKLKDSGLQKITFAGGEPLLYKYIVEAIIFSKEIGLTTSIITNGSFLTPEFLNSVNGSMDWVGVSVDSLNTETNKKIGRNYKTIDYYYLVDLIKSFGLKLKINTVVNRFNDRESMQEFIDYANPMRWKIFDTLKVNGQNDKQFDEIKSTDFDGFISRHSHHSMVVEDNNAMTGSYLLIDPKGRLFENSSGEHTYSDPLQDSTVERCLSQISLSRGMFLMRGGVYKW